MICTQKPNPQNISIPPLPRWKPANSKYMVNQFVFPFVSPSSFAPLGSPRHSAPTFAPSSSFLEVAYASLFVHTAPSSAASRSLLCPLPSSRRCCCNSEAPCPPSCRCRTVACGLCL
ncbi:hypothetical protein Taro_054804 [Colocasia esculenta]|uniref:Uncharacterized protein n=1 Tax=Colocasia esculenta TaxID=4460 RepID=A0A843XRR3_COLES|nr:hypothetical protein [Colocasia esculenta]